MTDYLATTRDVYAEAAEAPDAALCCTTSPVWALPGLHVPEAMLEMNYGCGTTVHPGDLRADDTVLYVGVGGGMEALQFAWFTRREGGVIAVDPVARMRAKAAENLTLAEATNPWLRPGFVRILDGDALSLPLADASVSVAAQNCLFNIFTDAHRAQALAEMHRVLEPGGRLVLSDPVSPTPLPAAILEDAQLRARCLTPPTLARTLADLIEAGFGTLEVRRRSPYRLLDARRYPVDEDVLLESVEIVAFKTPIPDDGACVFTGRTAIWVGEDERFDDGKGHVLLRDVPLAVCDKTAAAFEALRLPDLRVTPSTWHYAGGGCC
ncbi:MAG: arsenosugar biosynthesis arsenite methyltransferase ArsM [Alphaproteobacteria bacterium]|nr:arsenosugar biosynthesis arsenite methyltransferase ArsM [Alphaproteobacteria bacterium]